MVNILILIAVDHRFKILSSQTEEYSCQEPAFQFQLILFFLPFEIYANNNGSQPSLMEDVG